MEKKLISKKIEKNGTKETIKVLYSWDNALNSFEKVQFDELKDIHRKIPLGIIIDKVVNEIRFYNINPDFFLTSNTFLIYLIGALIVH